MPNVAAVLKDEISRIARKEIKQQLLGLQKAVSSSRREIVALRGRVLDLERQLKTAAKPTSAAVPQAETQASGAHRFNAKGFAALRKRLGISAEDMGLLIGASGLSVYKWEHEKASPRAKFVPAIVAIRGIGKREAVRRLEALRP